MPELSQYTGFLDIDDATKKKYADLSKMYDYNKFMTEIFPTASYEKSASNQHIPFDAYDDGKSWNTNRVRSEIENLDKYKAFTYYVLNNSNDPSVRAYLKLLNEKTNPLVNGKRTNDYNLFKINADGTLSDELLDDWQDNYYKWRTDGKRGYYHLNPDNLTERIKIPSEETPSEETPKKSYVPYKPEPQLDHKYPMWSDWAPLTMNKINGDLAAYRSFTLDLLKKYPLKEAKYHQELLTNGHTQRLLLNNQSAELRARQNLNLTSDQVTNDLNKFATEQLVQKNDNTAVLILNQEYWKTREKLQTTANANIDEGVNIANENRVANTAAWNNIINAKQRLIAKLADLKNSFNLDMYTNLGEYMKTKRINTDMRNRQLIAAENQDKMIQANKDYVKAREFFSWDGAQNYAKSIYNREIDLDDESKAILDQHQAAGHDLATAMQDPAFRKIVENTFNSSTDAITARAKANREEYLKLTDIQRESIMNLIRSFGNRQLAYIDSYATNQLGPMIKDVKPSPLFSKSGGKLLQFKDFASLHQKEQESVRKNSMERAKKDANNLNKELDRLSKEELLLLRAVFK